MNANESNHVVRMYSMTSFPARLHFICMKSELKTAALWVVNSDREEKPWRLNETSEGSEGSGTDVQVNTLNELTQEATLALVLILVLGLSKQNCCIQIEKKKKRKLGKSYKDSFSL